MWSWRSAGLFLSLALCSTSPTASPDGTFIIQLFCVCVAAARPRLTADSSQASASLRPAQARNLSRIRKCLFPSYAGTPKAVSEIARARVTVGLSAAAAQRSEEASAAPSPPSLAAPRRPPSGGADGSGGGCR